jgi:hypothetical protein
MISGFGQVLGKLAGSYQADAERLRGGIPPLNR